MKSIKSFFIYLAGLMVMMGTTYHCVKGHFMPGPTCTVTSMIPGSGSVTTAMEGTCQSILGCRGIGGVPIGKCGLANVCCIYPRTCDSKTNQNQTYFTNPGYPSPYNGTISCSINIYRVLSPYRICQLRLDFVDFELNKPTDGDCVMDRFVASGQNANSVIPPICGRNTGQHMYMDVDGAAGPFTLRILTSGPGYRRWNIRISQIECANPSRAPANCLQYYTGPSGIFSSFNYELSNRQNEYPMTQQTSMWPREATYFNNMDYSICFRKEVGFCTQTYQVNTTYVPMEVSSTAPSGTLNFDSRVLGGAGVTKCPFDFLLLDGVRYCGAHLTPLSLLSNNEQFDAPVIDKSSGPFIARFVSNEKHVGRGFSIGYQQNPCGARIPDTQMYPTAG